MNVKSLESWAGNTVAVARTESGTFAEGAQGLTLEVWNTRTGPVVKATRRDAKGRILGPTNFRTKVRFA
jgi:hypothetical protein